MSKKQFIGGNKISKKQAYKGLGDPKTWEAEKKALMKEFTARPPKKTPVEKCPWALRKPLYIKRNDSRYKRVMRELKKDGVSYEETWALDSCICRFILPRLKIFRNVNVDEPAGYPGGITLEEWKEILDKMIFAFDWSLNHDDNKYDHLTIEEEDVRWKMHEEGMQLFAKWFRALWW